MFVPKENEGSNGQNVSHVNLWPVLCTANEHVPTNGEFQ